MDTYFAQPLNPRTLDPERVTGLLELGVERHDDRAEVDRFLIAGAEFVVGPAPEDPELVRVRLVMTENAPAMAELRAKAAGAAVMALENPPQPGSELLLIDAPARELQRINRG